MENYVLYEETDRYTNTIVYKGRKKGEISFVSIYCIEKCRRPEVTNRVRLTYEITHKNIVKFYEWYETNNHLWLVVELCSGGTLERLVQQDGHLPEDVTLRFASSVAAGLYHCHSLGIIFGPLRPSRILLDSLGVFKLADFGMSKLDGESLVDVLKHQFCEEGEEYDITAPDSNDSYRAPELGQNFDWSVASDLYSFGALLYHLFVGCPPPRNAALTWTGTDTSKSGAKTSPTDSFRDLISGLLVTDPIKRYTWSDILSHPVFGERLAHLATDGQTLLDSETATMSGDDDGREEESDDGEGNDADATPRASMMGANEETDQFDDSGKLLTSSRQPQNIDLNVNRPPTACGRSGMLTATGKTGNSLMASRPSTAGRLTPCQALDSGPVETRTARTPQHAMMAAVQAAAANAPLLGCGYEPDETVDWCTLQLFHESDLAITSIVDNQRIVKTTPLSNTSTAAKFDPKTLPVAQTTGDKLSAMADRDRLRYVQSLIDNVCGVNEKGPISAKRVNTINYCAVLLGSSAVGCDAFVILGGLSAVLKLIKESNQTVDNKQRLFHLLAIVCSKLSSNGIREDSKAVGEVVSICNGVAEILRDSYHQRSVRLNILPSFGELIFAVVRCCPTASGNDTTATVVTLVIRALKETDCPTTSHYAAKIIENVMSCPNTATGNPLLRRFLTSETINQLWGLFSNSNVDALKISCSLALSRVLLHDSALVGPLLDVVSLAGILDPLISSQSARVHQSLITILCVAICRLPKLSSSKEVLDALLFEMEHPSPIVRAKAYLGFSMVVRHNPEMLMYCTQSRLSSHLERDFHKAITTQTKHEYLEHGVASAVASLSALPPKLNKQAIEVLRHVSLKQHPTSMQTKQLNAALPGVAVVAYLISCSLIRQQVVDALFIADMVELANALVDAISVTRNPNSSVATSTTITVVVEDLRQGVLAALEATVQSAVADQQAMSQLSFFSLLAPSSRLVIETADAELQAAGLRLLTDLLPAVFKVEKSIENMRLSDLLKVILPTLDRLMASPDPLPTLAASFLLGACQISPKVVRTLSTSTSTLAVIVETLDSYRQKPTSMVVQHLLEILDTVLAQSSVEMAPFLKEKFIDSIIGICSTIAVAGGISGSEVSSNVVDTIARPLLATLSIMHNLLRHVALAARKAIQARQHGNASAAQEAAEEALKAAKSLTSLDSILVNMLMIDDSDMIDTAANILSLLAQLYGPVELAAALTEENVHVWTSILSSSDQNPPRAKSLLRTLRRLVQQSDNSPARLTALSSDGLVRAIEKLSTMPLGPNVTSGNDTATSTATEAANVVQLAHEIVATLAHSNK